MSSRHIVVATKNPGKAREFRELFASKNVTVQTLADFDQLPTIEETGTTFEENATIKATAISKLTNLPVVADDSGLVVAALNGEPGIYSARYAGDHDDQANNRKLLAKLSAVPDSQRQAAFHTTLVLVKPNGNKLVTEGTVDGKILTTPHGENGFGYDPLFWVPAFNKTMAEMTDEEKNSISHRGRALRKMLVQFDDWWEK
ncbi:XTP/dITP diphosphatase [Secundilactobacillus kimchicus]|uniref:dITP/XTP pyrophosphatase n=1 Tax=Secundilactobacillus kimchicus JCM 15530 TaxID=1302272 RepID=A0A0R1HKI5_9LACO|nr:XTP/dITP diphosphatase [Secundilactobacillus kimchicus]KRK47189.1 xanthosine triphosphate pyrophosphatase [Secundilactobacillus kimchicus JCM 15530]MBT9671690.1 XTP/dITP diphosphatase [Secundilactobacillus kimchicus]